MSDAGLVDAAVMEVLANDAALTALCPGGVFYGVAPQRATAWVRVTLFDSSAAPALAGDTLYEQFVYVITAVILDASKTPGRLAAARIHALLHGAVLDLSAAGYVAMTCRRERRVAYPEIDPVNAATWRHTGGQYVVMTYPTS
jgi:hypothetical protein